MKVTINFVFEKATKNTYRYVEVAEKGFEHVGVLYVQKRTAGDTPSPELTMTLEDS